ncbi:MAG: DUF2141 domain-containing protein [Schleiferiaceae bacterium]|nr:DUF2141 domain-containing protein [Schleiferiaceae bacterium]
MRYLLFGLFLLFASILRGQSTPMVFRVSAPEVRQLPSGAQWMVSLHDAAGNLIKQFPFSAKSLNQDLAIPAQKFGSYTASFYLDLNANNSLDKGLFGQPLEPYAFSNQARNMFSRPSLESQRFEFNGQPITVKLEYHFGGE